MLPVGSVQLCAQSFGEPGAPAILLIGGSSSSMDWWETDFCTQLAAGGRFVVRYDLRDTGQSVHYPPGAPDYGSAELVADALGVLDAYGIGSACLMGISMGGAIAQLVAREHPDVVEGLVLSGTAQHWQDPQSRRAFRTMGVFGLVMALAPRATLRAGLRRAHIQDDERTVWLQSELLRNSARDIAEAGRELGRFDSRPWLPEVEAPVAVVVTTHDELVPVYKQRALAEAVKAHVFEAPISHMEVGWRGQNYNPVLLQAIAAVRAATAATAV
jgi:pimeloyl-ACP methyl ester carboxylesterase